MNQGKWINVARVCHAARVLTPVVLARWSNRPERLSADCDKMIMACESAARQGSADHLDSTLVESMTMLVGVFHLQSQGYDGDIPELWDGNVDIRDALPTSPEIRIAVRNWMDTVCRCGQTAMEETLDGAMVEAQAGVSWALCTLEELQASDVLNGLRTSLAELDRMLPNHSGTKYATCCYHDGHWIIRQKRPWYRRWLR